MQRKQSATVQLKTRMKEPLRARLEEAAKDRGVSLNSELVDRLERSFERENNIIQSIGGLEYFALLAMLGNAVKLVEEQTGRKWQQDFETREQVKQAIATIFDAISPKLGSELPPAKTAFAGIRGVEVGHRIAQMARDAGLENSVAHEDDAKE